MRWEEKAAEAGLLLITKFTLGWGLYADQEGTPYLLSPDGETFEALWGAPPRPEWRESLAQWLEIHRHAETPQSQAAITAEGRWAADPALSIVEDPDAEKRDD